MSRLDQRLGDRPQPERGDGPVGCVGGRHAKAGREAHDPSLGQRPADDQQADRADGRGDREAEDETAERERGIHWVLLDHEKTPSAFVPGASLVRCRAPPGAQAQIEVARLGPSCDGG